MAMSPDSVAGSRVKRSRESLIRRSLQPMVSVIRCEGMPHELQTVKLFLRTLETKVADEGIVLTESQMVAREKGKGRSSCLRRDRNGHHRGISQV